MPTVLFLKPADRVMSIMSTDNLLLISYKMVPIASGLVAINGLGESSYRSELAIMIFIFPFAPVLAYVTTITYMHTTGTDNHFELFNQGYYNLNCNQ